MGKEFHGTTRNFCDLKSTRGNPARLLEAHHERQKESTQAIPTLTPAGASTISISSSQRTGATTSFKTGLNRQVSDPQGQHPVCGYADYRQPEFFKKKSSKEIQNFSRGRGFLIDRVGKEISCRRWYMDEKTPHLRIWFCPADRGQPPV